MKVGSFTPLTDLIESIAIKHKVKSHLMETHICFIVNKYRENLATRQGNNNRARATGLKNNTVLITVRTSAQANMIALHTIEILRILKEKDYNMITGIKTMLL